MKWLRRFLKRAKAAPEPAPPPPPPTPTPASPPPSPEAPPGGTMPLPPLPAQPAEAGLRFGWATDPGLVRPHNEDALLILYTTYEGIGERIPLGLFVVADGMGGHRGGEQASDLAVREIARFLSARLLIPHLAGRGPDQPIKELLEEALQAANAQILQAVPGGGTTVVCALVLGESVHLVHVGDSRAYLVWPDHLEQLTEDHSLVQRMISLQGLSEEQAAGIPRNVLYQALGHTGRLHPSYRRIALPLDAWLLLCTDGLWGEIPEEQILQTVWGSASPQEACQRLVRLANEAGGHDNISVILVGR